MLSAGEESHLDKMIVKFVLDGTERSRDDIAERYAVVVGDEVFRSEGDIDDSIERLLEAGSIEVGIDDAYFVPARSTASEPT